MSSDCDPIALDKADVHVVPVEQMFEK